MRSSSRLVGQSVALCLLRAPELAPAVRAGTWTIDVVLEGTFELERDDATAVRLETGDLVWHAGATQATLRAVGGARGDRGDRSDRGELLRASYFAEAGLDAAGYLRARAAEREPGLAIVTRLLHTELSRASSTGESSVARALLDPLLAYVARCAGAPALAAGAPVADPLVSRVLAELHARPAAAWSVEELARIAGLSRAAFVRRFVAELGVPPMRALAEHRMQLAARLLADTDRSLAEIAAEIGYASEFAFSKAFKREQGEAPALFRRRVRAELKQGSHDPIRAAA